MNRKLHISLLLILGLTLSACGKKEVVVADTPEDNNNAYGTGLSEAELRALGINGNPLDYKTVYFEYNSSGIDRRSEVIELLFYIYLSDDHAGSRTSPVTNSSRVRTRPSLDATTKAGSKFCSVAYNTMSPLGEKLGDSSNLPLVNQVNCPVFCLHNHYLPTFMHHSNAFSFKII